MKTQIDFDPVVGNLVLIETKQCQRIPAKIVRVSPTKISIVVKTRQGISVTFIRRLTDKRYRSNRIIVGYLKRVEPYEK